MGMDAPPCLLGYHDHSFMPGSRVCMRCWWAPRELIQPNPVGSHSQAVRRLSALEKVLRHWGNVCVFCGAEATTRDHLVPRSRGGRDALVNLRPACKRCNSAKGDMTPLEWLGDDCPSEFKDLVAPVAQGATLDHKKMFQRQFVMRHRIEDILPDNQLEALRDLSEQLPA